MNHFHHTGYMGVFPFHRMRQGSSSVIILVRFDVGFIFQVESVFVAQIVPVRIVRIVGVTYVIDVGAFHQHNLFLHHFTGDGMSHSRI